MYSVFNDTDLFSMFLLKNILYKWINIFLSVYIHTKNINKPFYLHLYNQQQNSKDSALYRKPKNIPNIKQDIEKYTYTLIVIININFESNKTMF